MDEEYRALNAKYRSMALRQRSYQDKEVATYVQRLSLRLRHATAAGFNEARDIVALLACCEPLESVDDLRKAYLRIGFLAYAEQDMAGALRVAEAALMEHGDDAQLRRCTDVLRTEVARKEQECKESRRKR